MQIPEPKALTAQDVQRVYEVMLGRPPESTSVVAHHLSGVGSLADLVRNIAASAEFAAHAGLNAATATTVTPESPFWHFHANVDVRGIIQSHAKAQPAPLAGHYVNFLGAAVPTKVMTFLNERGDQVDPVPIPANYHADMAEWGGALRAVDLAKGSFTMIELGCGWACWMTNTGVAARARGLQVQLIGIEGDPTHLQYACETMAVNGFSTSQFTLLPGVAAAGKGFALFPTREVGSEHWGSTPIFGASLEESDKAVASGKFESLKMVPLSDAIGKRAHIDLLHIDIQGGEADLIAASIDLLSERVAYIVIGTHSRQLEGRLMDLLLGAGWLLEIERPAIIQLPNGAPQTTVDGVQAWRNPRLLPTV